MTELEPEASRRLERYFEQMRAALRGSRSVDPADVEADVSAHIQSELASLQAPVTVTRDAQGLVQGYERTGWVALACTLAAVALVGRLKVVGGEPAQGARPGPGSMPDNPAP